MTHPDPTAQAVLRRNRPSRPATPWQCLTHDRELTEHQARVIHSHCDIISTSHRFEMLVDSFEREDTN